MFAIIGILNTTQKYLPCARHGLPQYESTAEIRRAEGMRVLSPAATMAAARP